ncbi:MAG: hypothetical protein V1717_03185 [Candidatus Micrarchaeota archaeon]
MGLLDAFETETLVILVVIMALVSGYSTGQSVSNNPLVLGFGLITTIPFQIIGILSSSLPLAAPVLAVGVLAYIGLVRSFLGPAVTVTALVSAIILMIA